VPTTFGDAYPEVPMLSDIRTGRRDDREACIDD
jgi:hypothetical protein